MELWRKSGRHASACRTNSSEPAGKRLQVDEIWPFVYAKEKNVPVELKGEFGYGDVWTFTAIDAETELIPFSLGRDSK